MAKPTPQSHGKTGKTMDTDRLDRIVADARHARDEREKGYRERALKMYPWVCGRCGRTFTHVNLRELTVHHRDHDHDNNPPDGSNWELLCLYCHDNEHQRYEEHIAAGGRGTNEESASQTKHRPFEGLEALLKGRKQS